MNRTESTTPIVKLKSLYTLLSLLLAASLGVSALAQQPTSGTPSVDRIRQVISYLASDALEGRRTGTPGANDAAHYIAGEFNRYGLRPGLQMARPARTRGENQARYLQPFPFVAGVELGENNFFFANPGRADDTEQFRVGEDWMPLGFSSNGSTKSAEMVFAGFGISSAELKYDDYAVSNVKGQVAIVLAGTPDRDNPHGQFARAGEIRFKVAAARAAGAQALVIITDEEKLKDDRLSRLSYDNAGEAGIPVIVISRQLAANLLRSPDAELLELEKIADSRLPDAKASALRLPLKSPTLTIDVNVVRRESPSFNVIGILPGSDPKWKNEAIVIGAHYDHLGRGGEGSGSLDPREGLIHHGADDNASGVAGLIELARMFSTLNLKPRRTIVFIAFSGEEEGLIGSSYYVNHPIVPLANTVAMINMDMIGRMKEKNLIVGGVGTAQEWRSMIDADNSTQSMTVSLNTTRAEASAAKTFPIVVGSNGQPVVTMDPTKQFSLTLNEDGYGPSDHSSFYAKQVPVLFFWTGTHDDYHKPSDTADKINYDGEARIISFVARVVQDIDKSDKRPTYAVAKSESQGRSTFRVYLGTIPNYADSNDGLKLDGVRDDSPAAKAGLKAGDKIVKMAGHDVKNVYDYTYALGEMKAGQEYEVEIVRGSERLTLKITPAARK
jgi:Zn-dependent M28 family amino/carboxypeptidase